MLQGGNSHSSWAVVWIEPCFKPKHQQQGGYLSQKASALHMLIITSDHLLHHGFSPQHLLQVEWAVTALPSSPPNSGMATALA